MSTVLAIATVTQTIVQILGDALEAAHMTGAVVTALFFVFLFGPSMIAALRIRQGKGPPIREDGPQSHLVSKKGTPIMGGLMILAGTVISTLLWPAIIDVSIEDPPTC